ncbi:MAG: hypothetical protein PHE02_00850 [Lachnospiraceae bacterium]|nr:hypothetical protein [Lachnospiraceae bacterium]
MSKFEILRANNICTAERYGLDHFCMDLYEAETLLILGNCSSGKDIVKDVLIGQNIVQAGNFFWKEEPIDHKTMLEKIQCHEIFYASPDKVLIDSYTVAENIYVIRNRKKGIMPTQKAMNIQTANLLGELGFTLNPEHRIRDLDFFQRLLVCLTKAVSYDSKVILFDYMDNILQVSHLKYLKKWMEKQKLEGRSFIIFGEKYDEIYKSCDRVVIMSDGRDKKIAPVSEILKNEIPYYWLGEAYSKFNQPRGNAPQIPHRSNRRSEYQDMRRNNILGIYDKDWGNKKPDIQYFVHLYEQNYKILDEYNVFFDPLFHNTAYKNKQYIFIENIEYDKILSSFPLAYNLMIPRNKWELLSRTSRIKEEVMVQEFYKQFEFLKNKGRHYSEYFFYRLVAIYRFERFRKPLMILDNAFLRLDIVEENYMRDYIFYIAEKMNVILISHRLNEIDQTAGTILYVEDGKIVQIDSVDSR